MKLRTLLTTLALGAAASLTSAPVLAQMVPCNSYTCMAGMSGAGATGGPGCEPATQAFFSIVIYDEEGIDFPATALARQTYLMTCPGATTGTNAGILEAIIAEWGMVVY